MTLLLVSATCGCALQLGLRRVLLRLGVVDRPNARSSHTTPVVRAGGIALAAGVVLGLAVADATDVAVDGWAWAALLGFFVLGLLDDVLSLPVSPRLGLQLLLALVLVASTSNGGSTAADWALLSTLGVVGTVSFVNAFNFMDGINGISGLTGLVYGGWFVFLGHEAAVPGLVVTGSLLAGACLGFLPWNLPHARIFLGDSGSYLLGALTAYGALSAIVAGIEPVAAVAPLLLYLADTGTTLLRRIRAGQPWQQAHRDHVYQRLTDRLDSHARTALLIAGASAGLALLAVALTGALLALALFSALAVYVLLPVALSAEATRA